MTDDERGQVPDPTILTTEAVERAMASARDLFDSELRVIRQRLDGMDRATDLIDRQVTRVPTEVDRAVNHLKELVLEKFASIDKQFANNHTALNAALAAQKEAVGEQNKANAAAIGKSEQATDKKIDQLAELFKTSNAALSDQLTDAKERLTRMESLKQGGKETMGGIYAALAGLAALLVIGGILAAAGAFR